MQYRKFGRTGCEVPIVGQGTWNLEHADRRAAIEAVRRGLDLGATHIDTAEAYGNGRVEEILAEALDGRRDETFLVSKVTPWNASRHGTIEACHRSLTRLKTDRLDCYLLHWPGSHPLEETIEAFEQLEADGKIRSWGLSNFDEQELAQAVRLAGVGRIACNQVLYHLEERAIEHAVVPFCEEHGIAVVGYSPFGSGRFPSLASRGGRVLKEIAEARGWTARQVALSFLTRRPSLFTIPKASQASHVKENAAAAQHRLSEDEVGRIDRAFPRGRKRKGVPTL